MEPSERKPIRNYRDLIAWQKAMNLAKQAYQATLKFPNEERFGLTSQMRRAAVSVPSNIAEGFGRARKPEFRRFLEIARGSLFEFQTQAKLARRLGLLAGPGLTNLRDAAQELEAILNGLVRSQRN
jgi:four helix bundle protein